MSRHSVPKVGMAGLQQTARLAGESFGHEDLSPSPRLRHVTLQPSLWWLAAAVAGLVALSLR